MLARAPELNHTLVLHGSLGKEFKSVWKINASSPAQVLRCLILQIPGFGKAIEEGSFRVILGRSIRKGLSLDEEDFKKDGKFMWDLGDESTIHIIPSVAGAGRGGGVAKVIIGAVIMIAAIVLSYGAATPAVAAGGTGAAAGGAAAGAGSGFALSATAFTVAGVGVTYGSVALFGAALMFSGVASLMAPTMSAGRGGLGAKQEDQRASFLFNGPVNLTEQGHPVPLVYGRCRAGSIVISSGLAIEQI